MAALCFLEMWWDRPRSSFPEIVPTPREELIFASTAGLVKIDPKTRCAQVIPKTNAPVKLCQGDIVVGEVIDLKDSLVIVSLAFKKGHEDRPISDEEATIHISNVRNSYVKDLRQLFSLRDILKAKIIDERQMRLSTGDEDLGSYQGLLQSVLEWPCAQRRQIGLS